MIFSLRKIHYKSHRFWRRVSDKINSIFFVDDSAIITNKNHANKKKDIPLVEIRICIEENRKHTFVPINNKNMPNSRFGQR